MSLEERLAKLERRCRLLTLALAVSVLVPAVLLLTGAAQNIVWDNSLRTSRLDIVDRNNQLRAQLGQINNEFGLFVFDAQGQMRAALAESPEAASLSLSKPGGSLRLIANLQGSEIALRDSRDAIRAGANATVAGGQLIINANGGQIITLPPADN